MAFPIRFAAALPQTATVIVPPPAQVRFGRDEIFERNDRFEKIATADWPQADAWEGVFNQSAPTLEEVRSASAFLYNEQGRIRGHAAIPWALEAAQKEVQAAKDSKASPVEQALSKIKLANARLAADRDNEQAFQDLDEALRTLKEAGFKPTAAQRPLYMHGLYNRGAYFMTNALYKETAGELGPAQMAISDATHEGLTLQLRRNSRLRPIAFSRLKEGLPFLDEAIALSEQMDDKNVSRAEYLSAKGEALHLMTHLVWGDISSPDRIGIEKEALDAFRKAMDGLEAIPPSEQTAQHAKLIEKIGTIKIPHLCDHPHEVQYTGSGCALESTRAQALMATIDRESVPTSPDTPFETEGKAIIAASHAELARLERLRETDPEAFRLAMIMRRFGFR